MYIRAVNRGMKRHPRERGGQFCCDFGKTPEIVIVLDKSIVFPFAMGVSSLRVC